MDKQKIDDIILKIFFTYAWTKKPKSKLCQCGCENKLPEEINSACMDHLLEKSKHPDCKYSISNIMYVTSECHANKTNGFPNSTQKLRISKCLTNIDKIRKESSKFEKQVKDKIWQNQK